MGKPKPTPLVQAPSPQPQPAELKPVTPEPPVSEDPTPDPNGIAQAQTEGPVTVDPIDPAVDDQPPVTDDQSLIIDGLSNNLMTHGGTIQVTPLATDEGKDPDPEDTVAAGEDPDPEDSDEATLDEFRLLALSCEDPDDKALFGGIIAYLDANPLASLSDFKELSEDTIRDILNIPKGNAEEDQRAARIRANAGAELDELKQASVDRQRLAEEAQAAVDVIQRRNPRK